MGVLGTLLMMEISTMNKEVLDLANKVAENKETLVAAFMLAYPDVPIEDILLVQSTTDTGFTISVQETWERATHLTSAEGKALAFRNKKLSEKLQKLEYKLEAMMTSLKVTRDVDHVLDLGNIPLSEMNITRS